MGAMTIFTGQLVASTASDEDLFELLAEELERRLPNGRGANDAFVADLCALPVGLRSMAATYELDVSLSLDDLGWHFGNWHHLGLAEQTAVGLEELGAIELAGIFREAMNIAQQFWIELGSSEWSSWYSESELEKAMAPINEKAWAVLEAKPNGIFSYWVSYARQFPERLG
jgi:hypothetical protein